MLANPDFSGLGCRTTDISQNVHVQPFDFDFVGAKTTKLNAKEMENKGVVHNVFDLRCV